MNSVENHLHNLRHSAAHLLAQAVQDLFPGTKMTIGPVTEYGFFYDFLPVHNFKEDDLPRIEDKMRELAKKNYAITGKQVPKDEARKLFASNPFKLEIIDEIPGETVGVYWQGDFYDLCRGGHVDALGEIKYFKLMAISGAYWRGDREKAALQRISGIAFETQKELDDYLNSLEEARLNDHRSLGKQLDLFSFHHEAAGMPFFHAKGMTIYQKLLGFMRSLQRDTHQEIKTPFVMSESIWHRSGHYDFYKDNMFFAQAQEDHYCVKPMNCPGATFVYQERPRSYRELPLRLAEFGQVHRYELSGVLHGLFRTRTFTIDDCHIFCTLEQLEDEIAASLARAQKTYKAFGFEKVRMALSTRPEKFMGSEQDWEQATDALKLAFDHRGIEYKIQEGEGAFYGPKIEIKIEDAMGREWQCGTVQVDFNMPINFDLNYVAADQSKKRPVMVHVALYGSIERFFGIILEHFKGKFPFWLAPVQLRILPITDKQHGYAEELEKLLRSHGIRAEIDASGDQLGAQVRRAQLDKIPWMLVVGGKEAEARTVTIRYLDGKQEAGVSIQGLLEKVCQENDCLNQA